MDGERMLAGQLLSKNVQTFIYKYIGFHANNPARNNQPNFVCLFCKTNQRRHVLTSASHTCLHIIEELRSHLGAGLNPFCCPSCELSSKMKEKPEKHLTECLRIQCACMLPVSLTPDLRFVWSCNCKATKVRADPRDAVFFRHMMMRYESHTIGDQPKQGPDQIPRTYSELMKCRDVYGRSLHDAFLEILQPDQPLKLHVTSPNEQAGGCV